MEAGERERRGTEVGKTHSTRTDENTFRNGALNSILESRCKSRQGWGSKLRFRPEGPAIRTALLSLTSTHH